QQQNVFVFQRRPFIKSRLHFSSLGQHKKQDKVHHDQRHHGANGCTQHLGKSLRTPVGNLLNIGIGQNIHLVAILVFVDESLDGSEHLRKVLRSSPDLADHHIDKHVDR